MQLKTTRIQAIEKATTVNNSTDLELLGTEALIVDKTYAKLIEQKEISSSQNSFLSLFGLDTKFFYSVTLVCESYGFTEYGLGYIYERDSKFFLNRFSPFYMIENGVFAHLKNPRPIVCSHDDHIIASSYIPSTFIEMLTEPNSVITSEMDHLPTSISVNKNSVLGRYEDNLQSIPLNALIDNVAVSEVALSAIKEHTKQLILKSSKIDVKRLTANNLQFNPRPSAPERKGVLYYDETDDCLKYYTGTEWRILMWTKDDE